MRNITVGCSTGALEYMSNSTCPSRSKFSPFRFLSLLLTFFLLLLSVGNAQAVAYVVSTSVQPAEQGSFSPVSQTVNEGNSTSFTVTANSGYTIDTVTGCGGSGTSSYLTAHITAPCTVTANFIPLTYTVSTSAPAGQGSFSPASSVVNPGNTTTFNVTPVTGYSVGTVTGCGGTWTGSNPYTTGPINATCTVVATFTLPVFTSAPAGQGSFSPSSRTVTVGDTTTFTVTAEAGYSINTVTGCAGIWTGSNPYTTGAISTACTVTATFNTDFIVTPSPAPHGTLLAASATNGLALKGDGSMVQWGSNSFDSMTNMPAELTNVTAVAAPASAYHSLALKDDGTVVTWGNDVPGILTAPAGLVDVIAIAAGDDTGGGGWALALKKDGTVVGWGNGGGTSALPADLSSVIAIAAAGGFGLAIISDGTVVQWGFASGLTAVPAGLTDVISVAGGIGHALALKSNGTVIAWGSNDLGQATVPAAALTGVVAIAAGSYHSVALKDDGTVVAWGNNSQGQAVPPPGLTGVVAISAGQHSGMALKSDGSLVHWGLNSGANLIPAELDLRPFHGTHGTISPNIPQGDISNGSTVQFTLVPDIGYTASVGGSCGGNLVSNTYTTNAIMTDCSVQASFVGRTITASVSGGNGSVDPLSKMVADGATASFTATPVSGYVHDNAVAGTCPAGSWSTDVYTTDTVNADCSVIFSFSEITYLVSASVGTGGSVLPASRDVTSGSTADFTVTADANHTRSNVIGGDCPAGSWSGDIYTTGAVSSACSVSFSFIINTYLVSASSDAGGEVLPTSRTVDSGTTADFTVTPNLGFATDSAVGGDCLAGTWNGSIYTTGAITGACSVSFTNSTSYTATPFPGSPAVFIAGAYWDSLALKNDSSVAAWGGNTGILPAGMSNVVAMSGGTEHFLALKSDGTVTAWGTNGNGESDVPAGLDSVVGVAAGDRFSLVLKDDGTALAWGLDYLGRATVPDGLSGVIAVTAGSGHSLALKSDGTVVAWGSNAQGQTDVPTGLNGVVAVAAGFLHSLALKSDGTVVGWGYNNSGQTNVPDGLNHVVALASGARSNHSLALKSDGTVVAWGQNSVDQTTVPAELSGVVAVATGGSHSLALKKDGSVIAWGYNANGQSTVPATLNLLPFSVAHGTMAPNTPQSVGSGNTTQFTLTPDAGYTTSANGTCGGALVSNTYTTNAITADCVVKVMFDPIRYAVNASVDVNGVLDTNLVNAKAGTNASFSVTSNIGYAVNPMVGGNCPAGSWDGPVFTTGIISGPCSVSFSTLHTYGVTPSPRPASFLISGGETHTLALKGDGTVEAWGYSAYDPHIVPGGLNSVVAVAAGDTHSLALKDDGSVVAWGRDDFGQSTIPASLSGVVAVAGGVGYSLVLKADGTVVAWGDNSFNQTSVPADLHSVVGISSASYHSLALRNDGRVVAWGYNAVGGTDVPADLTDVVAVAAGGNNFSLALKNDGTIVGWGGDAAGELNIPSGLIGVASIAAGGEHSLALKNDGTVVAWGSDSFGQSTVPAALTDVVAIAAGSYHSVALKADGAVVAWGWNASGQTTVPSLLNLLPFHGAHGRISPDTLQILTQGATASFTATADSGFMHDDAVGGTCAAGSWVGDVYTTGAISAACAVSFSFTSNNDCTESGGVVTIANRTFTNGEVFGCQASVPIVVGPNVQINSGAKVSLLSTVSVQLNAGVSIASGADFISGIVTAP